MNAGYRWWGLMLSLGCQEPTSADTDTDTDTDTDIDTDIEDSGTPEDTGETSGPEAQTSAIIGVEAGSMLGWQVATAGVSGLLVSAPGSSQTGAIYRFPVSALDGEVVLEDSNLTIEGAVVSGLLGYGLASLDVNGDSVPEIAAGVPGEWDSTGAVYVFDGTDRGRTSTRSAMLRLEGPDPGASFGGRLAAGQGALLLVSASDDDSSGVKGGAAYAYSLTELAPTASIYGDEEGQQLGIGSAVGDLNGDGVEELVVGCAGEGSGSSDGRGDVGVFFGPVSGTHLLSEADVRMRGADPQDHLGNRVSAGPDLDGDGYGELAVGAYWVSEEAERGGAVYVFSGPLGAGTARSDAVAVLHGEHEYGYGGISVVLLADATGDGLGELLIGEYGAPVDEALTGA
ncbi:MAG: hypothetical protein ACI8S6_004614, partial [Myxococcota bacterium]